MEGFYKSQSISCGFLFISYKKNDLDHIRILIKVKKQIGNAPVRNSLKRKVREFFRLNQHIIKPGYDFCVVFKTNYINTNKTIKNGQTSNDKNTSKNTTSQEVLLHKILLHETLLLALKKANLLK